MKSYRENWLLAQVSSSFKILPTPFARMFQEFVVVYGCSVSCRAFSHVVMCCSYQRAHVVCSLNHGCLYLLHFWINSHFMVSCKYFVCDKIPQVKELLYVGFLIRLYFSAATWGRKEVDREGLNEPLIHVLILNCKFNCFQWLDFKCICLALPVLHQQQSVAIIFWPFSMME